jgi:hypothetical protein
MSTPTQTRNRLGFDFGNPDTLTADIIEGRTPTFSDHRSEDRHALHN